MPIKKNLTIYIMMNLKKLLGKKVYESPLYLVKRGGDGAVLFLVVMYVLAYVHFTL